MRLVAIKPHARRVLSLAAAALLAAALVIAPTATHFPTAALIPAASAACPDAEVVFARGREEPPGVGAVGDALVNSLRSKVRMSVGAYGVNYPANISTGSGANDMSAHVQSMARSCPNTRIVLGGYSQGAGVIDLSTTAMPPQIADHVAAMALFGAPRSAFADTLSPGPLPMIGALYTTKTIDLCVPNDPICSDGWDMRAHVAYVETGMTNQAATFAASRL